jgi:hypothetical protein
MNIRITFPLLLIFIVAIMIATTQPSSAITRDQGSLAFGQGEFTFFTGGVSEHWSFAFDATANKKDHARGRAIFDITRDSTQSHVVVKIDCLDVISTQATMTGTVLHSDDPEFPKRANVIFGAADFSSFPNQSDIITRLFVFEGDCHEGGLPLTFFLLDPSAITVQP